MRRWGLLVALGLALPKAGWCASGTEAASFLDIPVGGAPAALGSAYSAQANDVYAPVWNPAGLGFLHSTEFTGMHLSYIGPLHYEHAGIVVPLGKDDDAGAGRSGIGASIQYLGTGNLDERDESGNSLGSFTSAFAAYSLAYGQRLGEKLSLGVTGKLITEKISDASASAYGADAGLLYRASPKLRLAAVLANVGSDVKFVNEGDPLPTAGRLGATYQLIPQVDISGEGVYRKTGLASGGMGVEWRYGETFSFRAGYNTEHIKELGAASGFTAGIGVFFWGQEFSYAYVPIGDLGDTHYFSLVFRWSTAARPDRPRMKSAEERENSNDFGTEGSDGFGNMHDFLNDDDKNFDN
jgi:hypothetical protein